jgi:hypothetical protein
MALERVRLEIGFEGGTVVVAHVSQEHADRIEHDLTAGSDGTVELEVEDGRCLVVLSRVLYVKRFSRGSRVGFGAQD